MTSRDPQLVQPVSPIHDLFQIYFQGLDIFASPMQPLMKGCARANLEFWELASRRSRAGIEFPAKIAVCTSPVQVYHECQNFWATAARDCNDAMQRVSAAVTQVIDTGTAQASAEEHTPQVPKFRDVIIIEPATPAPADEQPSVLASERHRRQRQVA